MSLFDDELINEEELQPLTDQDQCVELAVMLLTMQGWTGQQRDWLEAIASSSRYDSETWSDLNEMSMAREREENLRK